MITLGTLKRKKYVHCALIKLNYVASKSAALKKACFPYKPWCFA